MVDVGRSRRLAGRIKQIVATHLETQIKDPRLGMVTVTDVKMTGDLHDATVFYTVYGDELARMDSAMALESARGVIRSEIGRQTGVRFTPTVAFQLDAIPETAKHIDALLTVAQQADAEVEKVRAGAQYAGDADPYKPARGPQDDEVEADTGREPTGDESAVGPSARSDSPARRDG